MGLYIGTKEKENMILHANQEWGHGRLHQLSLRSQHGIQLSCSSHGSITRGNGSGCGTLGSGSIRGLDVPLGAAFLPGGLCTCGTVVQVKETAHIITEVNVYICHMAETLSSNSKSHAALLHVSRRQSREAIKSTSSAGQALTCESLASETTPDNAVLFKMAHLLKCAFEDLLSLYKNKLTSGSSWTPMDMMIDDGGPTRHVLRYIVDCLVPSPRAPPERSTPPLGSVSRSTIGGARNIRFDLRTIN